MLDSAEESVVSSSSSDSLSSVESASSEELYTEDSFIGTSSEFDGLCFLFGGSSTELVDMFSSGSS